MKAINKRSRRDNRYGRLITWIIREEFLRTPLARGVKSPSLSWGCFPFPCVASLPPCASWRGSQQFCKASSQMGRSVCLRVLGQNREKTCVLHIGLQCPYLSPGRSSQREDSNVVSSKHSLASQPRPHLCPIDGLWAPPWKVDIGLPVKGNSNSYGARPVH